MNDIYGNEIKILPMSDRNVRVVDKGDKIIMGAMSIEGMAELTSMYNAGEYKGGREIDKVDQLVDGTVYMITFKEEKKEKKEKIFVFGANLQGIHGAGAAKFAFEKHKAIWGVGDGIQGNAYAIPTKKTPWVSLQLDEVKVFVDKFIQFAIDHPEMEFFVTKVGCGLAGFKNEQVAPLFASVPSNCEMPIEWEGLYESGV